MSFEIEVIKIRNAIRRLMKQQKRTVMDLSRELDVSLATAKRLVGGQEGLSFERFLRIAAWLEVTPEDIHALARQGDTDKLDVLTEEQEEFLAADDAMWSFFNFLYNGRTPEQLQEQFNLTTRSMRRYLRELEKAKLISVNPNGKIQIKRLRTKFRPGGPVFLKHAQGMAGAMIKLVAKASTLGRLGDPDAVPPTVGFHATDYSMRAESYAEYSREVVELHRKYGRQYGLEHKSGALKDAGRLYSMTLYFYDNEDDPALVQAYTDDLPGFHAIKNIE